MITIQLIQVEDYWSSIIEERKFLDDEIVQMLRLLDRMSREMKNNQGISIYKD